MEKLIQDKQQALLHLIQHVGYSSVKRNGAAYAFYDLPPYQVLLNLMMEKGSPATLRERFAHLGWDSKAEVKNFLYEYSELKSAAPVQPGNLISFWNNSRKYQYGVALKVNETGNPTEYVALEEKNYKTYLRLMKQELPLSDIFEIFDPNTQPRQWADDETAREFYGDNKQDALMRMIRLQGLNPDGQVKIGGDTYSLDSYQDTDLFRHLALSSPLDLRPALFIKDHKSLLTICSFFGEGVKPYQPTDVLRYGTVVFLENEGMGVILASTAQGKPAVMLSLFQSVYQYRQVKPDEIKHHWYPSVQPYKHTGVSNNAYTSLDGFIRHLVLWWYTGNFGNKPLFKSGAFLPKKHLSESFISLLNSGPDKRADWKGFLASKGKGLLHNGTEPAPGDLLIMATEEGLNPGIALHNKQVMYFNFEYAQKLVWKGVADDVLYVWRPGE